MFFKIIFLAGLVAVNSFASLSEAEKIYRSRGSLAAKQGAMVIELVNSGHYFAAIPWMKEYLIQTNKSLSSNLEQALEKIISVAGPRQFETLPLRYLQNNSSSSLRYVMAKKLLREGKHAQAINQAEKINPNHPVYPFAANLLAAAFANMGKTENAIKYFNECQRASESMRGKTGSAAVKNQLRINSDYCELGVARAMFAANRHKEADLKFLDIPKSSPIWPEVLFEEAWNSYYLKNYNRTLGKLVTYKAPIFDYIFNPEIETLQALTYLKMCLYQDAKHISDSFYDEYLEPARRLRLYLKRNRNNYKYFYRLMLDYETLKKSDTPLLTRLLKSVYKEGAYQEIRESLILAAKELERTKGMVRSSFGAALVNNLNEVVQSQKDIMGAYVKSRLVGKYAELYKAFEGMSYIKLEVLEQRKARLYRFEDDKGKRGDLKYIERNEKQYFWNFNGEFWADELGDYVFALRSEC